MDGIHFEMKIKRRNINCYNNSLVQKCPHLVLRRKKNVNIFTVQAQNWRKLQFSWVLLLWENKDTCKTALIFSGGDRSNKMLAQGSCPLYVYWTSQQLMIFSVKCQNLSIKQLQWQFCWLVDVLPRWPDTAGWKRAGQIFRHSSLACKQVCPTSNWGQVNSFSLAKEGHLYQYV